MASSTGFGGPSATSSAGVMASSAGFGPSATSSAGYLASSTGFSQGMRPCSSEMDGNDLSVMTQSSDHDEQSPAALAWRAQVMHSSTGIAHVSTSAKATSQVSPHADDEVARLMAVGQQSGPQDKFPQNSGEIG